MSTASILQRVANIAGAARNASLWRRLRPAMTSRTGLPIVISSLSEWDIFSEIWVSNEYDEPVSEALNAAGANDVVQIVDLGANVGFFSLRCVELRNLRRPHQRLEITAVEGVARTFQTLTRNLADLQDGRTSVALHHGLVGQRSGVARIYDRAYSGANTVVPANGRTSSMPFRGAHAVSGSYMDLETVLPPGGPIDLLKCDIEGSEAAFLRNYSELLKRTRRIVIEIHPQHCRPAECRELLAAAGLRQDETLRSNSSMILETYSAAQ
jgi:FkbM family methyltransferase